MTTEIAERFVERGNTLIHNVEANLANALACAKLGTDYDKDWEQAQYYTMELLRVINNLRKLVFVQQAKDTKALLEAEARLDAEEKVA